MARQAGDETQDVEVTPEMIEAGALVLSTYSRNLDTLDEKVASRRPFVIRPLPNRYGAHPSALRPALVWQV